MATDKTEAGAAEDTQQEGAQQQEQENEQQPVIDQKLARQLEGLKGLVDTSSIIANLEKGEQQNAGGTGQDDEEEEEEPGADAGADKDNPAKQPPAAKKEAEPAQPSKQGKLGLQLPGTKKGADVIIEKPEQILGVVNTKFGMDIKEVKDLPKFFEQANQWRSDAQNLKKIQSDFEDLQGSIKSLPIEFVEAIDLFVTGQDYTAPFKQKSKFDFNVPAEKQDMKSLVNHYFPGKFTDEDFKEETPSAALEIAITASQDKFSVEKKNYDGKRASVMEKTSKDLESLKASVTSSVSQLKKDFPNIDVDTLKEVETIFEGGPQGVANIFFNKDGTVKPEAAKMAFMAKYGDEEIQVMMENAARNAESKTNEEILTRGADGRKPVQKNAGSQNMISEEMKQRLAGIPSQKRKNTY